MSENYSPGPGVEPQSPYTTVFLSQRDLGLKVPINYVTTPGVSFTAACFPTLGYEDINSAHCFSNLLAVGFRRFEIDLYWDQGRTLWSFCPVEIPPSVPNAVLSSATTPIFSSSPLSTSTSEAEPTTGSNIVSTPSSKPSASGSVRLGGRQATPGTTTDIAASSISLLSSTSASSLGETLPSISILPNLPDDPLISLEPYFCTTTINLSLLTSLLLDYIQKTQNTLSASVLYITINIHAAASTSAPSSPAPSPSSLPTSPNLIGTLFQGNLSAYLYTPSNLISDRANLNDSWYQVNERYRPVSDFYLTEIIANGIVTTDDGWPSESYIEFSKSKRLLLGWGQIDPQMAGYNFSADSETIFPQGYIEDAQTNINATAEGILTHGCFFGNSTNELSQVNSSWAVAANLSNFSYPTSAASNLYPLLNLTSIETGCGISPILNATLLNSPAHENYIPYQNFSYATIWSWAPGEPKTYDNASLYRCATSNIDLSGRWVVADCSRKYFAACRALGQPYNWTINTYQISYSYAKQACPDGYSFAAPRTALENAFLNQAMRQSRRDFDGHGAWVDFNSLDVKACWTTGGPNVTCPYSATLAQEDDIKKRVILIPTVAAIIVLIITALTIFVKAAGNSRKTRRKKKRADNGFIYEGVPS